MPSIQELEQAMIAADKAGDTQGAQVLANEITKAQSVISQPASNAYNPATNYIPSGAKSFLEKIGIDFNTPAMQKYAEGYKQMPQMLQDPYLGLSTSNIGKVVPEMFPNVIAKATQTFPEKLMQSALKPTLSQLQSGKASTAVKTMLEEGINPTEAGVQKLQSKISDINTQIADILGSYKGTINKSDVLTRINEVKSKFATQATPTADLKIIDNAVNDFIASHPEKIPVTLAQKIKQGTYKVLSGKFGEQGSALTETQKGLARGLKEEIANKIPEISGLNARESKIIDTLNVVERRALMELNKNPVGLTWLAENPMAAAGFMADKSALAKSLLARMIYNAQKATGGMGGLLSTPQAARATNLLLNPNETPE